MFSLFPDLRHFLSDLFTYLLLCKDTYMRAHMINGLGLCLWCQGSACTWWSLHCALVQCSDPRGHVGGKAGLHGHKCDKLAHILQKKRACHHSALQSRWRSFQDPNDLTWYNLVFFPQTQIHQNTSWFEFSLRYRWNPVAWQEKRQNGKGGEGWAWRWIWHQGWGGCRWWRSHDGWGELWWWEQGQPWGSRYPWTPNPLGDAWLEFRVT